MQPTTLTGETPNTLTPNKQLNRHPPLILPVLLGRIPPSLFEMLLCVPSRRNGSGLQVIHKTYPLLLAA